MDEMSGRAKVSLAKLSEEDADQEVMDAAVRESLELLGGVGRFISEGDKVLLKPNQTLFLPYTSGTTTSPRLIRSLVSLCFEAGAKEVWVAEASGHAQKSRHVMDKTGMVSGVEDSGAHLIYLDEIAERVFDFGEEAGELRHMPAPEIMERADVLINVPKAKTHFVDPISCACKNWVGVIPMSFRLWLQRQVGPYYRGNALFLKRFKPALTVVDGGWAGEGQGPGANDPFWWGWVMASPDPVAADVTVARLFELEWQRIRMAKEAAEAGVGVFDADRIDLVGGTFEDAHRPVKAADPSIDRFPCRVIVGREGATIEGTLGHWKTIADGWHQQGLWKLFTARGTPTFLFGDAEDPDFEKHVEEGPYVVFDDAARDRYKYDPRVTYVPGSPVPQSYMQNEMVNGMGFGGIYQAGLSVNKMIQKVKGVWSGSG